MPLYEPALGGSTTGTALLDFGAYPGNPDASVTVTGQTGIVASSSVECWIFPVDTADHSADEHTIESLTVFAGNIVAGAGFTIYGYNYDNIFPYLAALGDGGIGRDWSGPQVNIHGKWTIGWSWQ